MRPFWDKPFSIAAGLNLTCEKVVLVTLKIKVANDPSYASVVSISRFARAVTGSN